MLSKESKGSIKAYAWFYNEHVAYAQVMVSLSLLWYCKLYYCYDYYHEIALKMCCTYALNPYSMYQVHE